MIRFIYVYREKATGSAVYVGSTFTVENRDRQHCTGKNPFDFFLRKMGRENFTLDIVEAFRAESREEAAVLSDARETHWIELLQTSYKHGGQNIVTPKGGQFAVSQEKYEAMCRNVST